MLTKERELQRGIFDSDLIVKPKYKTCFYRREVPIGESIPDIVAVNINRLPKKNFWPQSFGYRHVYMVWLLRNFGEQSIDFIAKQSSETLERTTKVLDQLVESGAILKIEDSLYSLANQLKNLQAEVISIEVKLKDWNRALDQAIRYRKYSNKTIVAMPLEGVPSKLSIIDKFRKEGIGLCSISQQLEVSWVVRAKYFLRHSAETEYLIASVVNPKRQTLWTRL